MSRKIFVVRHAETASNALDFYPPKVEDITGHLLAASVHDLIETTIFFGNLHCGGKSVIVYSSAMMRAIVSAKIIASTLGTDYLDTNFPLIDERDLGENYGRLKSTVTEDKQKKAKLVKHAGKRLDTFIKATLTNTEHEIIVIVTHAGPIKGLMASKLKQDMPTPLNNDFIEVTEWYIEE